MELLDSNALTRVEERLAILVEGGVGDGPLSLSSSPSLFQTTILGR
jgi:hypothetical protein